jgi:hypothetical protein
MLFFKKKVKVNLIDFCTKYYNENFLAEEINNSYFEVIRDKIVEDDKSFSSIDFEYFCTQMLILRYECFAIAWYHEFGIKPSIENSIFTKEYLESLAFENIWEGTMSYNKAVSQSTTHGCDSSTMNGRARISFLTTMKVELFEKHISQGFDSNCVARVLNRYGTEPKWKRMVLTFQYLTLNLLECLNCNLNEKAKFILVSTLKGFYDGSKQTLENIKIID